MKRPAERFIPPIRSVVAVLVFVSTAVVAIAGTPAPARGHGSMQNPPSRSYACRFLVPDSPMCAQAWAANPQALYDWMEVNIGDAAGRHRELIPDGQLCSAGRPKYAAFDAASASWPATELVPDADGRYTFTWTAWAPHSTAYYRLYLTQDGFDPSQPLRWDELELVHDSGPQHATSEVELRTQLPQRSGRHILYTVWQRDDSAEAFYACSDVTINQAPPEPIPTPPPADETQVATSITSDWGTGYCADATVSTTSAQRVDWTVAFHVDGTITTTWNADVVHQGHKATAQGHPWNNAVSAAEPQSFGFCAARNSAPATTTPPTTTPPTTAPPTTAPPSGDDVSATVTTTSDWGSGYCANVEVAATGTDPVDWTAEFDVEGTVYDLWSANWTQTGNTVTAEGVSWNNIAYPDRYPHVIGFCASR